MRKPKENSFKVIPKAPADPTQFYYKLWTRYFYWKRLELAERFWEKGPPAGRCLELACGSGILLPELSRHCRELHAVDLRSDIDNVNHMLGQEGVRAHVRRADICRLPFPDGYFDLVVGMSCLEHLERPEIALREAKRVLKPDGRAIFGLPIETWALKLFFKAVGFDHRADHVSRHDEILRSMRGIFSSVECARFPARASLYIAMQCGGA